MELFLGPEILREIGRHLPMRDVAILYCVSKLWKSALHDSAFWHVLTVRDHGLHATPDPFPSWYEFYKFMASMCWEVPIGNDTIKLEQHNRRASMNSTGARFRIYSDRPIETKRTHFIELTINSAEGGDAYRVIGAGVATDNIDSGHNYNRANFGIGWYDYGLIYNMEVDITGQFTVPQWTTGERVGLWISLIEGDEHIRFFKDGAEVIGKVVMGDNWKGRTDLRIVVVMQRNADITIRYMGPAPPPSYELLP